jgi:hypothetical protein
LFDSAFFEFPQIFRPFSWRKLTLVLELVTADFGNHCNTAANNNRQNFCNVCFQPKAAP